MRQYFKIQIEEAENKVGSKGKPLPDNTLLIYMLKCHDGTFAARASVWWNFDEDMAGLDFVEMHTDAIPVFRYV